MYGIGFTILEKSKLHMFRYYYDVFLPHFRSNGKLEVLFSDTDSFALKIKSDNFANDMLRLQKHFDFSNYPQTHPLYSEERKNMVG